MTTTGATKFFAVVALATAAGACEIAEAERPHAEPPRTAARPAPAPTPAPTPAPAPPARPARPAMSATPRVLPNGRPACGNVQGRSIQPVDCAQGKP